MQVSHPERTSANYPYWPGSIYSGVGQVYNMTLQAVLDAGYDIGLEDYPIWDETERDGLNQLIVDHFRYREIGAETPKLFIYFLNRTMREEMRALNVVFESMSTLQTSLDLLNNEEIWETGASERADMGQSRNSGTDTRTGTEERTESSSGDSSTSTTTGSSGESSAHGYASTNPSVTMVGKEQVDYYNSGTYNDTTSESSGTSETASLSTGSTSTSGTTGESLTHGMRTDSDSSGTASYETHRKGHYGRTLTGALREYMDNDFYNVLLLLFKRLEPCFSPLLSDHFNGL